MNKICIVGRLTANAELKYTGSKTPYTRFTIAATRNYKDENGEYGADFISCVAWREKAKLICEKFEKGTQIGIDGRLQTGTYEKGDGTKGYLTDVVVENITFLEKKKGDSRPAPEETYTKVEDNTDPFENFGNEVSMDDNDLPF